MEPNETAKKKRRKTERKEMKRKKRDQKDRANVGMEALMATRLMISEERHPRPGHHLWSTLGPRGLTGSKVSCGCGGGSKSRVHPQVARRFLILGKHKKRNP